MSENLILNPGFEIPGGGGADVFANWVENPSGTSTINDETVDVHSGGHACRFDVDASNNLAHVDQIGTTLIPGARYRLSFWYKNSEVGKVSRFQMVDSGNNIWLTPSGIFSSTPTGITPTNALEFTKYELFFNAHISYANYKIHFYHGDAASSSVYFDDIELKLIGGIIKPIKKEIIIPILKAVRT